MSTPWIPLLAASCAALSCQAPDTGGGGPVEEAANLSRDDTPDDDRAAKAEESLQVSFLLSRDARSPSGIDRVETIARELGLEPTSTGKASMSLEVSKDDFERLFGGRPTKEEPRGAGESDFGAPAGYSYDEEIPVPEPLSEYVEFISVEPPALRLDQPTAEADDGLDE